MRKIKNIFNIFIIIALFIFIFGMLFTPVKAVNYPYTPLTPIGDYVKSGNSTGANIGQYINNMYRLGVGIATVLAVLMIMFAGIEYMSTDAIGGKEEAKSRINNALLGLFIALGSFLILKTINPAFLETNLDKKIGQNQSPQQADAFADMVATSGVTNRTILMNGGANGSAAQTNSATGINGHTFTNQNWNDYALQLVNESKLLQLNPSDAANYFPNGEPTAQDWVNFIAGIAYKESGFNPNDTYTERFKDSTGNYVQSVGLLALSQESARGYGFNYTTEQLKDPYNNLQVGVKILERWVERDGVISDRVGSGSNDYRGGARYWSVLR